MYILLMIAFLAVLIFVTIKMFAFLLNVIRGILESPTMRALVVPIVVFTTGVWFVPEGMSAEMFIVIVAIVSVILYFLIGLLLVGHVTTEVDYDDYRRDYQPPKDKKTKIKYNTRQCQICGRPLEYVKEKTIKTDRIIGFKDSRAYQTDNWGLFDDGMRDCKVPVYEEEHIPGYWQCPVHGKKKGVKSKFFV